MTHTLPPTSFLGRYVLDREVGSGGMATVYRAQDVRHNRKVAVKILRPEVAAAVGVERFLREVRITARLQHPHILGLIDSGEQAGTLFFVMPFVEGESLRQRIARDGELPVSDAVRLLRELADALDYAHARGIIHRDIKPANVLVADGHAYLSDFGIATALHEAVDSTVSSAAGLAVGTPIYMAPEQADASATVDHRADLYSLGVLAFELLVGHPPFSGLTMLQLLAAHATQLPEPLRRQRPDVPPALEQIVMRCLEKRVTDRWQSAAELLDRLAEVHGVRDSRSTPVAVLAVGEPVDRTFRLTAEVCSALDRGSRDRRMIGDDLHYLDNQVESETLVCYMHPTGLDQDYFASILRASPWRGIAPTLYGFEKQDRRGVRLSLHDHLALLAEFVGEMRRRYDARHTILVGHSAGGDVVLRLGASDRSGAPVPIDGIVALSCNVSRETCFATRVLAQLSSTDPSRALPDLRAVGSDAVTMDDWLDVQDYFVRCLRKFRHDVSVLQRFASDIAGPFMIPDENPFPGWLAEARARVRCVRCVFESSGVTEREVQKLRARGIADPILAEALEDSIVIEPDSVHFDLVQPTVVERHVRAVIERVERNAN